MYADQDRGDKNKYQRYLAGMDTIIVEKVASASAYFFEKEGYAIVDVGMASGTSSYILALLFPKTKVIGIDINPKMVTIAKATYTLPNLEFRVDDGETLASLSHEKINGFFNCSSIHHITSFNNYAQQKAFLTLQRQAQLLCDGGILVVRDFVKPEDKDILIQFPDNEQGQFDANLLKQFAQTARSLSPKDETGFPLKTIKFKNREALQLSYPDAIEFIRRKDYLNDWDIELQEEYGYYSQNEFEDALATIGMRTIVSQPIYNAWIINNRYLNKFQLHELDGTKMGIPPTNFVIAAEKVNAKGTLLRSARHLPIPQNSFIEMQSFINTKTKAVFDVAQRPGDVIDILPYISNGENITLIAKHAYPRPILHQIPSVLDGKRYSGYIVEGVTTQINNTLTLDDMLQASIGLKQDNIDEKHQDLSFYSSPGGVNEMVSTHHVQLTQIPQDLKALGNSSGFNNSGQYRTYDALQLLKSAQVGALPEARLELSIYRLFQHLNLPLGKWLGETIDIAKVSNIKSSRLRELLEVKTQYFERSTKEAGFLNHRRTKFYEYPLDGSEQILEYIEPNTCSSNTMVTLPVFRCEDVIYVGVESRQLPVPQLKENNSHILTAPAFRLPKSIHNLDEMKTHISNKSFFGSKITQMQKLGEKYMPCIGISPEQVYPYVLSISEPTDQLHWVRLNELVKQAKQLRDGHLLIALHRLKHVTNSDNEAN